MKGLMIAEHLASILVLVMAVAWIVTLQQYQTAQLVPLRTTLSVYRAANLAITSGETRIVVANRQFTVTVTKTSIEVVSDDGSIHQTLRRDDD